MLLPQCADHLLCGVADKAGNCLACADEAGRVVEELRSPKGAAAMRAGTREELEARYGLKKEDFVDCE